MFLNRSCAGCGTGQLGRRQVLCGGCRTAVQPVGHIAGLPGFTGGGALFHYNGPVRLAIVAAKAGARPDVFRALAVELADLAMAVTKTDGPPALVTWVPASRRGRAERGFDQGRVMAGVIGRQTSIPVRRVLASGRSSQLGRGRAERLASDGFRARGAVSGSVLLVDDVITTGASMVSAARALRSAGASSVFCVAVAWAASAEELSAGRPLPSGGVSGPFAPA